MNAPTVMKVLVLNSDYTPMSVISWDRAVVLMMQDKADAPPAHDGFYKIRGGHDKVYDVPTVVIMKNYKKQRRKKPPVTMRNIFIRDNHTCQYCGISVNRETGDLDHVYPQSRGGKKTWDNMVTSCRKCNRKKAARTPEEAKMKLRCKPVTPSTEFTILATVHANWQPSWEGYVDVSAEKLQKLVGK